MAGGTTRHDGWSDFELQILYDLVNDAEWFDEAREYLPRRTDAAIRHRMSQLRNEAKIVPTRRGPTATFEYRRTCDSAKAGSDKYLAALLEMVA